MATGGSLIGALRVTLGLDSSNFEAGTKRARSVATRDATAIQAQLAKIQRTFDNFKNAAMVTALVAAGKRALEYASSLGEVAQQLGVTTKELQEYRYAGSQVGISTEEMDKALAKLTRTIGEAKAGSKAQVGVFRELGVAIQDANGRVYTAGELMPKLADALSRIKDPATRARIEVDLLGKTGQRLDTLLASGSAAINNLRDAAQKLGIVLSDRQIQSADETADKLSALKQVLEANIAGVVADNAGAILSLANSFAALANAAAQANQQVPGLLGVLAGATIGGKLGGAPGAAIGGIAGLLPALYDRAFGGDPHNVRGMSKKDLVARQFRLTAQIKKSSRSGHADTAEFKELTEISDAIDAEINRRMAVARSGKAPPVAVPAGALPVAKGGTHHAKRGPKDHTEQYLERFNKEMAGLADDQLQLQQQITTDVREKARLEHARIDASAAAYEQDVDSRLKQGELNAEQAAALKKARALNDERDRTLVNWKLDDQLAAQELDLTRSRLENANELLRGDLDSARTQAERRRIQLQILANEIELEKAALEAVKAKHDSTDVEYQIAQAKLDQLNKEGAQRAAGIRRDTMGPLESYLDSLPRTADEINEAFEGAALGGLQDLKQGLIDAALHGGKLGDAVTNALDRIQEKLLDMALDQAIKAFLGGLQKALSGTGWAAPSGAAPSGGFFASNASVGASLGGGGGGGGGSMSHEAPAHMATGGSIRVGGIPGVDRNVLAINGIPRAMVSSNETVHVNPANDRGGRHIAEIVPSPYFDVIVRDEAGRIVSQNNKRMAHYARQNGSR